MAFVIPIVAGVAFSMAASKIYAYFKTPAQSPPPPPTPEMTQKLMIKNAQEKLGMDIENHYNLAVCGNSGTGKSTFINCIRSVIDVEYSDAFVYIDSGPAPSGINETTMMPTHYCWPNNEFPYLSIWDMPGGGTQKHPGETYFDDKTLYAFDCLLLLKSGRFTQLDTDIYRKAVEYKIPIAIVLTKADNDIKSRVKIKTAELRRKLTKIEYAALMDETIRQLKNNVKSELMAAGFPEPNLSAVFVVAAQSYRDEKLGYLDDIDCPPLETEKLFLACCHIAIYRRSNA
ncbi:unnamed protein product [Rotaria socialis]|uniref:IRG-type G domain-containing protein n=1 Tax=Rotaria socialis TaxID=392032 RepID=A0A820V582_9BILA|nr:unnamed protein product [Rotaria socialis]CAF3342335.1 unnamed protein product [Rotaria socialis]CAF3347345.1 unnamed protein product [Rotaria socialis]CAF3672640.1 unnamed protein product [Rotaria socialis]CAF4437549.1 unnamed protein product [Rotaria socialis]